MLSEWDDTAAYLPLANKVKSQSQEEERCFDSVAHVLAGETGHTHTSMWRAPLATN